MRLSDMAAVLAGELRGSDADFVSVSTDTRTLGPASVFFALAGERFDAHEFLAVAREAGAVAAVVSRPVDVDMPQIIVSDTRHALGQWAKYWASRFRIPRIAVTGSCGKTSVKEMMAAIMARRGEVLATQGNLNNDIGVPLTLLRMGSQHASAVLELGANHMGEIAYTVALVEPDVVLITNVGEAHLEGFGTRDNIARAKAEIYGGLRPDGIAVINADDAFAGFWRSVNASRTIRTFSSRDASANVHLVDACADEAGRPTITVSVDGRPLTVRLKVLGMHQVINALAAIAATSALGVSDADIVSGLESLDPIKGRMYPRQLGQWQWIEDSYNANPSSMKAALTFLGELPQPGIAVLGGMGELGPDADEMHVDVGAFAARAGVTRLLAVGQAAPHYARGFLAANPQGQVIEVVTHREAAERLIENFPQGRVLVKGSRSARMESVFDEAARLLQQGE